MMSAPLSERFPATAWSCIEAVGDPDNPTYVSAVNRLITTYWRPVFRFLCSKYPAAADPEGLTQQFFLTLITKGWLARADRQRGRFRDFLKTLLKRFAFDQIVRAPEQVQFERRFVSIHSLMNGAERDYEPLAGETPEEVFDREWKTSLIHTVQRDLEAHYANAADASEQLRYTIFAALNFAERSADRPTQEAVAERFSISRDQVRYAVEQVRKRYERLLRQELRDQSSSEEEVEEAIRELL